MDSGSGCSQGGDIVQPPGGTPQGLSQAGQPMFAGKGDQGCLTSSSTKEGAGRVPGCPAAKLPKLKSYSDVSHLPPVSAVSQSTLDATGYLHWQRLGSWLVRSLWVNTVLPSPCPRWTTALCQKSDPLLMGFSPSHLIMSLSSFCLTQGQVGGQRRREPVVVTARPPSGETPAHTALLLETSSAQGTASSHCASQCCDVDTGHRSWFKEVMGRWGLWGCRADLSQLKASIGSWPWNADRGHNSLPRPV